MASRMIKVQTILYIATALPLLLLANPLHAHEGHGVEEARAARSLAANCAACHGASGKAQGNMPVLAGKSKEYLVTQLLAYKSGKREGTIMPQIAKGYSDLQISRLAEYFADQK